MAPTKNLTDFNDARRLVLQIERDLLKQSCLKTMLATASVTIANNRQELRTVKNRMARAGRAGRRQAGH